MMDGKTMWNEEKVKELIELYRQYNVLWDAKHPDFKNRAKKNGAVREIGGLLNCESLEVERKIHVILAQYRRTRLKLSNMQRAGATEDAMEKNLWYGFKLLRFLEDRGLPEKVTAENDTFPTENQVVVLVDAVDEDEDEEIDRAINALLPSPLAMDDRKASKRPQNMNENSEDDNFRIVANASSSAPSIKDEYSLFGEQLAFKIRKMDPILRLETQHKINCIVFDAEMRMAKIQNQ